MLILHKNICYGPSSEPSQQDGSGEGSQYMVSMKIRKYIIKSSLLSRALLSVIAYCVSVWVLPAGYGTTSEEVDKEVSSCPSAGALTAPVWHVLWPPCATLFIMRYKMGVS